MAPEDLDDAHATLCKVFTHPTRIRILLALEDGPLCVQELADLLGVRQPTLSQHLAPLRSVELVRSQRKGRTVCYRLANRRMLRPFHLMRRELRRQYPHLRED